MFSLRVRSREPAVKMCETLTTGGATLCWFQQEARPQRQPSYPVSSCGDTGEPHKIIELCVCQRQPLLGTQPRPWTWHLWEIKVQFLGSRNVLSCGACQCVLIEGVTILWRLLLQLRKFGPLIETCSPFSMGMQQLEHINKQLSDFFGQLLAG